MSDIFSNNTPLSRVACNSCKHYDRDNFNGYSCKAFKKIPDEILMGDNKHLTPLADQDNDIVFEQEKE